MSIVTHLWQSHTVNTPLKTHPKLWQDAAPAPASFMNVTPCERKMITLQRRQGGGTGRGGRKGEKKNHFDGLCTSWDNLVTFLDRILTRPDSVTATIPFFSSISFCHPRRALAVTSAPTLIPNDTACRN